MSDIDPSETDAPDECGLYAIYIYGHCVLPKGHQPASDHMNGHNRMFTRGLTKDEGGHD